ncbi:hypothetical protein H0H92_006322 [Tricholoma furcatifolium]|nr:hypothetical protein H0H92_006322 [Tricholoma furcatifolium]
METSDTEVPNVREHLQWVFDGRKLASEFWEAIQVSSSHLYHTALALAPEQSLLHELHSQDLKYEVKVLNGNLAKWPIPDLLITPPFSKPNLLFSPDGKLLALFGSTNTIYVYDVSTGEHIHSFLGTTFCFSPTVSHIAVALSKESEPPVTICDLRMGTQSAIDPMPEIKQYPHNMWSPAFSPSGQFLAISNDYKILILNFASGQQEWVLIEHHLPIHQFRWLQEGPSRLIMLNKDSSIQILDVDTHVNNLIMD